MKKTVTISTVDFQDTVSDLKINNRHYQQIIGKRSQENVIVDISKKLERMYLIFNEWDIYEGNWRTQ